MSVRAFANPTQFTMKGMKRMKKGHALRIVPLADSDSLQTLRVLHGKDFFVFGCPSRCRD
jgi:hypothetical protein